MSVIRGKKSKKMFNKKRHIAMPECLQQLKCPINHITVSHEKNLIIKNSSLSRNISGKIKIIFF